MQISTISFDGDMTLWDFMKVMRHSLKQTLTELQKQVPTPRASKLTVDEMITIRDQLAEEVKGEIWSLLEIRRRAFERHLNTSDTQIKTSLRIWMRYTVNIVLRI